MRLSVGLWKALALFLLLLVIAAAGILAQTTSGEISGQVVDPTGAAVVGATVTLTNQLTGDTRAAKTQDSGQFAFVDVQPGQFAVSVEATGFKKLEKSGLSLSASQRLSAGTLKLELGAVSQSVSVTATPTPVQTDSAERSALLDSNELEHISTPGHDVLALVRLLPGVVKDGEGASQLGTESAGAVSGTREVSNSVSVDGVNGNPRGGGNRFDTPLNSEAVGEVKVLLNDYQAEYGQSGGATIIETMKSGTQAFHGEAYYYNRNEDYNANDTFNKNQIDATHPNGQPRPLYRFNTVGYNVGGPIFWPGKFNTSKNKLFFFFSQEIWPSKTPGTTEYFMMPTALEKQGDFSQSVDKQGDVVTLTDPKNCGPSGTSACLLDPKHVNPLYIDPNTQALLNVLPTGNATPLGDAPSGGKYNYVLQSPVKKPVNQQALRVDYNVTEKLHMFVHAMRMTNNTEGPTNSPGFSASGEWGPSYFYDTPARNLAIGITYAATPSIVNEFTAGYADWRERSGFVNPTDMKKVQRGSSTGVNLGQFDPQNNPLNLVPNASFGGGSTNASSGFGISNAPAINFYTRFPFNNNTGTWEYTDSLTKVWNKHISKFGIFWQNGRYVQHPIGNQFNGSFNFGVNTSDVTDAGYAYANALLGNFQSYVEGTRTVYAPKWKMLEWYAQDNWKLTRNLTLDYGVRFSYDFPYTLQPGDGVSFVPSRYNASQVPALYLPVKYSTLSGAQQTACAAGTKKAPSTCAQNPDDPSDVQPSGAIGDFVGPFNYTGSVINTDPTYPRSLRNSNGVLVGPRLGVSWDPFGDGKTAIRAGAGIFYNLREDAGVVGDFATQAPVVSNVNVNLGNVSTFTPGCDSAPGGCANISSNLAPQNTLLMPTNHKIASTMSANFGIQRDIGFATVIDVAYVGTFGRHLEVTPNINEVPYLSEFQPQNLDPTKGVVTSLNGTVKQQGAISDNFFRPYPGYGTISDREYTGTSNYNALQATANHRLSRNLEFGVSYTWSKTMSYADTSSTGTAGSIATYLNPRFWNYGEANIDRTNDFVGHWVYDLPKFSNMWNTKVVRALADGWEWSGVVSFISGAPQQVSISLSGVNFTGGGDGTRILLFGSPYALPNSGKFQYLNPANFALPPVGSTAPGVINPAAIPSPSMPGITGRNTYIGPGTNQWDMTLVKNFHLTERFGLQIRGEAYNVFNHVSYNSVQDTASYNSATGTLTTNGNFGQMNGDLGPRILQLVGKFTF